MGPCHERQRCSDPPQQAPAAMTLVEHAQRDHSPWWANWWALCARRWAQAGTDEPDLDLSDEALLQGRVPEAAAASRAIGAAGGGEGVFA